MGLSIHLTAFRLHGFHANQIETTSSESERNAFGFDA